MNWTASFFFRVKEGEVDIWEIARMDRRRWAREPPLVQSNEGRIRWYPGKSTAKE
jgi:hypothetical protein